LPEEIIFDQYKSHLENIKKQLMENILQANPAFFESLVVKLLLKMGYGWDNSLSGKVLGGPGDDGIDGVINEDKLGLETIYIQAKRYNNTKVPSTEIRNFIGAMALKSAKKGVFFSTSEFTEQARAHANNISNMKITLVDGKGLCDLLIQYEMGVAIANQYNIFEINKNFFSE
jgi:restriction system protein